jgi:glucoamylase
VATPALYATASLAAGNPLCAVDPTTVPKAVDVVTPAGVSQATELNPLLGPVVIQGVSIP